MVSLNEETCEFVTGQRIKVAGDILWPDSPIGTIALPPDTIGYISPGWGDLYRIYARKGVPVRSYWVGFDSPQSDGSDDGPYSAGAVDEDSMVLI